LATSNQEQHKFVSAPSWCAEMGTIIDFEVLAEELGVSASEAFRIALDYYIAMKEHEEGLEDE
jgi:hypothetical protein